MSHLGIGLHYDVPAAVYHADPCELPSLSSSVLRTLLNKSIEHAALQHPKLGGGDRTKTRSMSLGSGVHVVLDGGSSSVEIATFSDYRTAEARAWKSKVLAAGRIPVLRHEFTEGVQPIAQALIALAGYGCDDPFKRDGRNEVTAIWKEDDVYCRARYDRLVVDPNGFADIWDWKTTTDVSPRALEKTIVRYGYHIQAAFYLRGLVAVLPEYAGRTSFIFAFVESAPPYAVRRVTLSPAFLAKGAKDVNRGLAIWNDALATSNFTAPNLDTLEVELPAFLEDDDEISVS